MLNLIQHLTKSGTYETLKRVQGDRLGLLQDHQFCIANFAFYNLQWVFYSTVTLFARFLGWSTSVPLKSAI